MLLATATANRMVFVREALVWQNNLVRTIAVSFPVAWPEEDSFRRTAIRPLWFHDRRKHTLQLCAKASFRRVPRKDLSTDGYFPTRYDMQAFEPVGVETFSSWLLMVASVSLYCLLSRMSVSSPSE